jgi:hypothetical protein
MKERIRKWLFWIWDRLDLGTGLGVPNNIGGRSGDRP